MMNLYERVRAALSRTFGVSTTIQEVVDDTEAIREAASLWADANQPREEQHAYMPGRVADMKLGDSKWIHAWNVKVDPSGRLWVDGNAMACSEKGKSYDHRDTRITLGAVGYIVEVNADRARSHWHVDNKTDFSDGHHLKVARTIGNV
jgi:hypothetical protein